LPADMSGSGGLRRSGAGLRRGQLRLRKGRVPLRWLYVCRDTAALLFPGLEGVRACVYACQAAADCAMPSAGAAFDADNYACIDGACVWTGCNSTEECTPGQVCGTTNG
jgi:hypothetical protein